MRPAVHCRRSDSVRSCNWPSACKVFQGAPRPESQAAGQLEDWSFSCKLKVDRPTCTLDPFTSESCAIVDPARLVVELGRVCAGNGVQIHEQTAARSIDWDSSGITVLTSAGTVTAKRAVLATNVFPSLLKRNRLHTVPVYDHVLGTEPLTDEQLARIGWRHRQGMTDPGNQFHYYRLSKDNRILWGGYDAMYHYGRRVDPRHEDRPESFRKLAAAGIGSDHGGAPGMSGAQLPTGASIVGAERRRRLPTDRAVGMPRCPVAASQHVRRRGRGLRRRRPSGRAEARR